MMPGFTKTDIRELIAKYLHRKSIAHVVFPTVRKVTPTLLSSQIVSVQPMALPVGLNFWLDFQYNSGSLSGSLDEKEGTIIDPL